MNKAKNDHPSDPSDGEGGKATPQGGGKVLAETINAEAGYNPYVSMYSLTLTALQLIELYDNNPGKESRMKRLDDLAKEFNRLISLPRK